MNQMGTPQWNLLFSALSVVISSAGSVLLNIVFATNIYRNTGSGLLTSLFLSLQWLPVLVVILAKSNWEDGADPRKRWIRLELMSAALTLPLLLFLDSPNYMALFAILFCRGLIDHVNRINKTVTARYIFPAEKGSLYASILQTSYHLGIGLAAIVGFVLHTHMSLKEVILLDASTFLIAASLMGLAQTLKNTSSTERVPQTSLKNRFNSFGRSITSNPKLFFSVILPPLSSIFFQGTYSVFQPIFPMKALGLSPSSVTISYVLASLAILGGSSLFAYLSKLYRFHEGDFDRTKKTVLILSGISSVAYILSVNSENPFLCAASFTLMIFTFEMIYMFGYAGIVAYAPQGELGSIFGITFCIGCVGASLCSVISGALLDHFNYNFVWVTSIFMGTFLGLLTLGHLIHERMVRAPQPLNPVLSVKALKNTPA
jgi:predicted MFS family arabinose efflux permease